MTYSVIVVDAKTGSKTEVPYTNEEIAVAKASELEHAWVVLRQERNNLLSSSDIFVFPDRWALYTDSQRSAWTLYRQSLRDLPANTTDPHNPVWPTKPE